MFQTNNNQTTVMSEQNDSSKGKPRTIPKNNEVFG